MTARDREREIEDTLHYLDALRQEILEQRPQAAPLVVLGFSQGSAAACRWIAEGGLRPDLLVLWGGEVPDDPGMADDLTRWEEARIALVRGERDEWCPRERWDAAEELLARCGHRVERLEFDGAHHLDGPTLQSVARLLPAHGDQR